MKYSEKISNKLNELLTRTYDAEKGYKMAQDKMDTKFTSVRNFIGERIQQRYNFGHDLKAEIAKYGELPEKGGSLKGDLHRKWMDLTEKISSNETERVLEEIERGEKASLKEYNDILNDTDMVLPPSTRTLLTKQRDAIKESLEKSKVYEALVS